VIDSTADSGVPHGRTLIAFVEAVLGSDEARLERARAAVLAAVGPAGLVDAAGAVASFNAVVKVADGSGLQVDDSRQETAARIRAELRLGFGPEH
jgi:hypothetical protein